MPTNKAGVILLDIDKRRVLLVHRLKKNDWSFPKGHTEHGENPEATAQREILEETGYSVLIDKKLPDLVYKTDLGEEVRLVMFLGIVGSKLQEPETGTESVWFEIHDIEKQLSYDNLKEYWRSIRSLILLP